MSAQTAGIEAQSARPQPAEREAQVADAVRADIEAGRYQDALQKMVRTWSEPLLRFCTAQLRDAQRAEDIAQEAFLAAYRGMARFRGESSPKTWLFGIARRRCLDLHRQDARHAKREQAAQGESEADPTPGPDALLNLSVEVDALKGCLAKMDADKRSAVLLRFEQGMAFAEVAEMTGERADTVKRRVYRALDDLRRCLKRKGVLDREA